MARLIEAEIPDFGRAAEPPQWRLGREGYQARLDRVRERMERHGWTHLIVYGDREHFANLVWLAGFDPRFEEALLVVGLNGDPLMLAGNECVNYLPATPAPMRVERYQWLSLPTMPNSDSRTLAEILRDEGIDAHSRVGLAGWKPYDDPRRIDAPSYMVDAVRFAAGWENVENAAGVFVDPVEGLRTAAAAEEIVYFEWTGTLASDGMRRVIEAIEPGALDHDLLKRVEYNGVSARLPRDAEVRREPGFAGERPGRAGGAGRAVFVRNLLLGGKLLPGRVGGGGIRGSAGGGKRLRRGVRRTVYGRDGGMV